MGQDKILHLFFEEPNRVFKIREIARITKIPKTTVSRILENLLKEGLLIKDAKGSESGYCAYESAPYFRICKKIKFLGLIYKSGLIEYIEERIYPRCIILFGSFAKGEYHKESDIDLFIQANEKACDLSKFERKLNHKINLFFENKFSSLSEELFNNIINGIKLSGYVKISRGPPVKNW